MLTKEYHKVNYYLKYYKKFINTLNDYIIINNNLNDYDKIKIYKLFCSLNIYTLFLSESNINKNNNTIINLEINDLFILIDEFIKLLNIPPKFYNKINFIIKNYNSFSKEYKLIINNIIHNKTFDILLCIILLIINLYLYIYIITKIL